MKKQYIVILSGVFLILAFVLGGYFYKVQHSKKVEEAARISSIFNREYAQTRGNNDARVTLVEFMDPACETCRAFYPVVKDIIYKSAGKVRLVVRYAPLHEGSDYVVTMLDAAKKQNKFWETLEVMYKYQPNWASHHNPQPQFLWQYLPEAGIDIDKLKQDMEDPEIQRNIRQDIADAAALSVTKTPGFFVNGKPLERFGHEELLQLIDREIKANY